MPNAEAVAVRPLVAESIRLRDRRRRRADNWLPVTAADLASNVYGREDDESFAARAKTLGASRLHRFRRAQCFIVMFTRRWVRRRRTGRR